MLRMTGYPGFFEHREWLRVEGPIGDGAQAHVFSGVLREGQQVAIKVFTGLSPRDYRICEREFTRLEYVPC